MVYLPRGKVLGGSSSINAMMYIRGNAYDYDHWAALGNEGWSYAEALPYFKKSENQERGADAYHGVGGLLNVCDLPDPHPLCHAAIAAAREVGIEANDDFNGARQDGVGVGQVNMIGGQRCSAAVAFLRPTLGRVNLSVETGAHVTRVLLDGKRAVGVAYVKGGEAREAHAEREVILCGGTYNSPQVLMLSGIGAADHLREHGIPAVVDLPGVGQNLQDHLAFSVEYRTKDFGAMLPTSNYAEGEGFVRTQPDLPAPDLQLIFAIWPSLRAGDPLGLSINSVLLRPESRGTIRLASGDPHAAPIIDPNYLSVEADLESLVEGFKLARKIGEGAALDGYRDMEIAPGAWLQSGTAIRAYIRERVLTVFHPVGTCKMGVDALAVVNERLQVHGVEGLRVVDGSIMPTLISGNTNAPIIMIAEKAADMIKADAG
jgi:choline dehydrogenase